MPVCSTQPTSPRMRTRVQTAVGWKNAPVLISTRMAACKLAVNRPYTAGGLAQTASRWLASAATPLSLRTLRAKRQVYLITFISPFRTKMSICEDKAFVHNRRKLCRREVVSFQPSSVGFHSFGQSGLPWVTLNR